MDQCTVREKSSGLFQWVTGFPSRPAELTPQPGAGPGTHLKSPPEHPGLPTRVRSGTGSRQCPQDTFCPAHLSHLPLLCSLLENQRGGSTVCRGSPPEMSCLPKGTPESSVRLLPAPQRWGTGRQTPALPRGGRETALHGPSVGSPQLNQPPCGPSGVPHSSPQLKQPLGDDDDPPPPQPLEGIPSPSTQPLRGVPSPHTPSPSGGSPHPLTSPSAPRRGGNLHIPSPPAPRGGSLHSPHLTPGSSGGLHTPSPQP